MVFLLSLIAEMVPFAANFFASVVPQLPLPCSRRCGSHAIVMLLVSTYEKVCLSSCGTVPGCWRNVSAGLPSCSRTAASHAVGLQESFTWCATILFGLGRLSMPESCGCQCDDNCMIKSASALAQSEHVCGNEREEVISFLQGVSC